MGATPARAVVKGAATHKQASPPPSSPLPLGQLKVYSNPDILICGNCREMFTELQELVEHKKTYCKLRFTCKCTTVNGAYAKSPGHDTAALLCVQCKDSFLSAWDLMEHVQAAHMLNIYELGSTKSARLSPALETTPPVSPNGKEDDKSVGDQDEVMTSPTDMEDELLEVESTAQACIMHALRIDSSSSMMTEGDHIMKPLTNGELKAQE